MTTETDAAGKTGAGEEFSTAELGASTGITAGTSSTAVRDEPLLPADGDEVVGEGLRRVGAAGAGVPPPRTVESEADDGAGVLERPERRAGAVVLAGEVAADESEVPVPVDPAEPVVSANANGIAARPEPTPRATASAPTRPTYLA